jgi:anti-anti-sigma factor
LKGSVTRSAQRFVSAGIGISNRVPPLYGTGQVMRGKPVGSRSRSGGFCMLHDTPIAVEVDDTSIEDGLYCLRAAGYLGREADRQIRERLAEGNGHMGEGATLVLNLSDVTFIDSAGISSLLSIQQEMLATGGRIILCNVPPFVNQTFNLVGMSRLIPVVDTVERARELAKS